MPITNEEAEQGFTWNSKPGFYMLKMMLLKAINMAKNTAELGLNLFPVLEKTLSLEYYLPDIASEKQRMQSVKESIDYKFKNACNTMEAFHGIIEIIVDCIPQEPYDYKEKEGDDNTTNTHVQNK